MENLTTKHKKRKPLSKEIAFEMLKDHFGGIFKAYYNALAKFNDEIKQTIPEAQTRLRPVLLNAKMIESFIREFPDDYIIGKYKRVIFRWNEMQLMIKKLRPNSKPSYIPTLLANSILCQEQVSLFADDEAAQAEPLLFFGYTEDRYRQLTRPRIVYFDGTVQWEIDLEDLALRVPSVEKPIEEPQVRIKRTPEEVRQA